MGVTESLVSHILESRPDEVARQCARKGFCDFLAACWFPLQQQIPESGLPILREVYSGKSAANRAVILGYAGHSLDFDDFHADFRGHPSTVILPALIAWCSLQPTFSINDFLDAYIIGVEIAGRTGLAITQQHYALGNHNTATLGTLAAAAALIRLTRPSHGRAAVLLGIAATQASGLRAQFASAVKPLHAGLAAERAVRSAQLALAGFNGQSRGVLESFLSFGSHGQARGELLTSGWGAPWRIVSPGLEFKPFATCSGTHSAAEAARLIRNQWLQEERTLNGLLNAIHHIEVAFPPGGDIAASVRRPVTGIGARFSLEYVVAAMLLYGDLRMRDFAEGPINADIMALAARVRRCPDDSAPSDALNPALRFHEVTLFLKDGRKLIQRRTRQQSVRDGVNVQEKLQRALQGESEERSHAVLKDCTLLTNEQLYRLIAALLPE